MKKTTLALLGISSSLLAAQNDKCDPVPPTTCYADDCGCCYCLGPENYLVNAPVCPLTCGGDVTIKIAALYWHPAQDGMEFGIDNSVIVQGTTVQDIQVLNNLIDAKYLTPKFDWDWGFKLGLGYCTTCDSWDLSATWTKFKGHASSHDEAESDDNHTLINLWSAFASNLGSITHASDIETDWKLDLNLADIELGRNFWVSRYLAIRPHMGIRISWIDQDYSISSKGGVFTFGTPRVVDYVEIDNYFKGVGLLARLDSTWNVGCGWAIYGNLAASIVYGRFEVDHNEYNRLAEFDHSKVKVLETDETFHASRAMVDLALGLQWSTMFCECKYGFTLQLGWEQHIFFHQNQMWRVVRVGDDQGVSNNLGAPPNTSGENVYHQRRGTLETEGITFSVKFDF